MKSKTKRKQIDFSDIPNSTDAELRRARRVGRPRTGYAKELIAFRVHPNLLAKLKKLAVRKNRPYQTLMHELLEASLKRLA